MDNEAQILLGDALACCQRDGVETRLINMLAQSRAIDLDDEKLTIEAPSRFAYAYLEKQRELIERYLEEIAFAPIALDVRVPEMNQAARNLDAQKRPTAVQTTPTATTTGGVEPQVAATRGGGLPWEQPGRHMSAPAGSIPIPEPARMGAAAPIAAEKDPSSVKVNNTMSPEMFHSMFSTMKQAETPSNAPRETMPVQEEPLPTPQDLGVNAKFTFETFVYGPENKHAYQSAVRFAALADEPGQCKSLFIYGKSGLGKTHLLLAIKNYLAQDKPYMKVKYANSQTYIDDFINEVAKQKTDGNSILREYHDADVLIIDDIQNIIGKQASIDYFFQLMDEFLRENKKVALASDRAPKDLGMDERLTSRFSAGMLCGVAEPGFEMKYQILRNYYEHTLQANHDLPVDGTPSLLAGLQMNEGKLTDEQLRHMAEISGNNIRELESFCERCASLSYEREQAGGELAAEDIDNVASEYFDTAHKTIRIPVVQSVVEEFYHVSHEDMIGSKRQKNIATARHIAVYLSNSMCEGVTLKAVGSAFGRDHTTVMHSIKVIEGKVREDANFAEELQQIKNKIILKS